ncbi:efflux RND transporter periplasmic adaptor subunit [Bergeyella sp. RCAD1439]|uniref:efflux RND transporter periplasmic adaptor subunit n=1 Tax=Bergeyella anatis TaxID=3113737 RepID=UPI002E194CCB|nr:efflux RND transporter periplasmic adaptor subunit [Bergeyella sp. RCAD1439]
MKKALAAGLFGLFLLTIGCKKEKEDKEQEMVYPVTTALTKDTVVVKEYVAQIRSQKNIEIRAKEQGFLQGVYVDEGHYVRAGQPLFQIMPQLLQAEVQKARAEVNQASIELQNASVLSGSNVVSVNEKKMAQAKLEAAKAELKLAQTKLSFTTIRAPFSGVINRLPLKIGSLVEEGALLTTLSDNSGIYGYFNVSEPEYLNYVTHGSQYGDGTVTLVMANGQPFPEQGKIETIEGEFDSETGNIAFRAKFPNSQNILRNGETGKIQMKIPLPSALIIPQKATYEIQDKTYVFVLEPNGTVSSRNIEVAYAMPDLYVVSSGLKANEKFLVEGIQKVKDEQRVQTKFQSPKQVMASLRLKAN